MKHHNFGKSSTANLVGVLPALIMVAHKTLYYSAIDFSITDGIRTDEEQEINVATGVSLTMNSKHLIQPDGFGHALDLVPFINGRPRWELEPCYQICKAYRKAAKEEKLPSRWGGAWCEITKTILSPEELVEKYVARKRAAGKKTFIDAPHYEVYSS